MKKRREVEIV